MSIDNCAQCAERIDTDFDLDCYETGRVLCKRCRAPRWVHVPMYNGRALSFACKACARVFSQANEPAWADLNGEPFKAYYCTVCAQQAGA